MINASKQRMTNSFDERLERLIAVTQTQAETARQQAETARRSAQASEGAAFMAQRTLEAIRDLIEELRERRD